ncbi:MAG: hypothetical protein N2C14_08420, partial [Planctomycetales bacterium]
RAASATNEDVRDVLSRPDCPEMLTARDAQAVCAALEAAPAVPRDGDARRPTALRVLASLFLGKHPAAVHQVLRHRGLACLMERFDQAVESPAAVEEDLFLLLRVFVGYEHYDGTNRVVFAARRPFAPDSHAWSEVFDRFHRRHPHRTYVLDKLRQPLPTGFTAVAYLDFANAMLWEDRVSKHPFAVSAGASRLLEWLMMDDPERFTFAQSAAAATPFLKSPQREQFLQKALRHAHPDVRFEGACAAARLKDEEGIKLLANYCRDPKYRDAALSHLTYLFRSDAIPNDSGGEETEAEAELCRWLASPREFGRPPDDVELIDSREIHWPPTRDRRRLRLFKYRYQSRVEDRPDFVGVGMVGSVTYSLYQDVQAETSADDVLALHCSWELRYREDPRAPDAISLRAGRAILNDPSEQ